MEMWPAGPQSGDACCKSDRGRHGSGQARHIDYQVDGSAAFWTIWISLGETAVLKEEIFTLASPNIERIRRWHSKPSQPPFLRSYSCKRNKRAVPLSLSMSTRIRLR